MLLEAKLSVLSLLVNNVLRHGMKWTLHCSTGEDNICELQNFNVTNIRLREDGSLEGEEKMGGFFLPASNLVLQNGYVPRFNESWLRPETKVLIMNSCAIEYFVIRPTLVALNLDENAIEEIAVSEAAQFELRELHVKQNRLSDLSFLENLTNLEVLVVEENQLEVLKLEPFKNLVHLQHLMLARNRIKKIEPFTVWNCELFRLDLTGNQLWEFLPELVPSNQDITLYIANNSLQSINIDRLSRAFPHLWEMDFEGNPWYCAKLIKLDDYSHEKQVFTAFGTPVMPCKSAPRHEKAQLLALDLPEDVDLAYRELTSARRKNRKLLDDYEANSRLKTLQNRYRESQQLMEVANRALLKLKEKFDVLANFKYHHEIFQFNDLVLPPRPSSTSGHHNQLKATNYRP